MCVRSASIHLGLKFRTLTKIYQLNRDGTLHFERCFSRVWFDESCTPLGHAGARFQEWIMSKERHVKKTAMTIAAMAFAGLMSTQASAAPLSTAAGVTKAAPSAVEHVRDGYDRRHDRWDRRYDRRDWRHDRRYYRYRNWNRYSHRPYNWRSRGCVAVGPVWFCQ
jgi:hypothetical protein